MKTFSFAVLLICAPAVNCRSADTKAIPARPEFAGLALDSMGYPTNPAVAYARGQADARRDFTNGVLSMKSAGLPVPWAGDYDALLEKRCHVRTDWLAGCMVTEGLDKYIQGYDEVSSVCIRQKFGTNIFDELQAESEKKFSGGSLIAIPEISTPSRTYTVRAGDTLTKIARQEGVTIRQLQDANPGLDPTKLRIGQKIAVAFDKTNSVPPSPQPAN